MSILAVNSFIPATGGTSFGIEGIAKAWAIGDGTGTVSLRGEYNVGSMTDNGTGIYSFNYTNIFSGVAYFPVASVSGRLSATGTGNLQVSDHSTSFITITTKTNSFSFSDSEEPAAMSMGDLA